MMYAAFSNYEGLNSEQMTAVGVLICERWERPFFVCDYWVEPRMSARVLNSECEMQSMMHLALGAEKYEDKYRLVLVATFTFSRISHTYFILVF